jgi:hypothetical protein
LFHLLVHSFRLLNPDRHKADLSRSERLRRYSRPCALLIVAGIQFVLLIDTQRIDETSALQLLSLLPFIKSETLMSLPARNHEGPNHHASPRSMLLRMPREVLGSILLVLRDDAVAQAGYTLEGSSDLPAGSPPGLSWLAATYVCGALRDVALAMPELWTVIVLEDGVAWANVFAKRSGAMPLSIHADCRRIRAHTVNLRVSRQRQREEVVILAAFPRFGSRVSRLTVQGYAVSSLQTLVDALNWSSLYLETLSLGNFSRVVAFRLPRTFLDKQAPHLTSLDLRHVIFDFQHPLVAFSNLRRLRLQFLSQRASTEQHTGFFCNWLKEMP